jgi:membrane-associated protein
MIVHVSPSALYLSVSQKNVILRLNMSWITFFIDFVLHIDRHLTTLIQLTGNWSYAVLWSIIFCETGFVVTPFLPGDSFLFAVGALSATDVWQTGWVWLAMSEMVPH